MPAATAVPRALASADSGVSESEALALARIAAAVAVASPEVLRGVMLAARETVEPAHVDEVLLQSYLFAGFPRTLNAAALWRELSGFPAPPVDDDADVAHASEWPDRGEATCRAVYGPTFDALRRHVARLHPALDSWMLVDGYGKVLSRPALPLANRERCIVAVCAVADQRPQLGSHLRGARRCGVTSTELDATLDAIADLATPDALAMARAELARLAAAHAPITEHS